MELTCMNHQVTITTDHVEQFETENPAQVIARVIEENRAPQIKKLPPLTGGLVGYFAYDYIKYAEPTLRLDAEDQEKFRDVDLMLFDKMIAFDHYRQKIILICNSRISEADVQAEGGQTAGAAAATDLRARGKARGQQQRMPRYLQQSPTPWKRFTAQLFRPLIRCRTSLKRVQKKRVRREADNRAHAAVRSGKLL